MTKDGPPYTDELIKIRESIYLGAGVASIACFSLSLIHVHHLLGGHGLFCLLANGKDSYQPTHGFKLESSKAMSSNKTCWLMAKARISEIMDLMSSPRLFPVVIQVVSTIANKRGGAHHHQYHS